MLFTVRKRLLYTNLTILQAIENTKVGQPLSVRIRTNNITRTKAKRNSLNIHCFCENLFLSPPPPACLPFSQPEWTDLTTKFCHYRVWKIPNADGVDVLESCWLVVYCFHNELKMACFEMLTKSDQRWRERMNQHIRHAPLSSQLWRKQA